MRKEDKVRLGRDRAWYKASAKRKRHYENRQVPKHMVMSETDVTYNYTNILIANRLSIQSMLENPIVKDVRARLFRGGV